jgi:hypothetical protein
MSDKFQQRSLAKDEDSTGRTAPVDFKLLDTIRLRLRESDRFQYVDWRPEYAPRSVIFHYDLGYYPSAVEEASLKVCWRENGDFIHHYEEKYENGSRWACRWDRHPNDHNTDDHYHRPPNANRPCDDADYPDDWRDILSYVLDEIDSHIKAFWDDD